jgi:hypothetical protein
MTRCGAFGFSTQERSMEQATELEYLQWFYANADFGPADSNVRSLLDERFVAETDKKIPEGYGAEE